MSKHTPGNWVLCEVGDYIDFDGKSRVILDPDQTRRLGVVHVSDSETNANAERIVACVNACEGIEDPSVVPELIAALRAVMAHPVTHAVGCSHREETCSCHRGRALAAIARTEVRK